MSRHRILSLLIIFIVLSLIGSFTACSDPHTLAGALRISLQQPKTIRPTGEEAFLDIKRVVIKGYLNGKSQEYILYDGSFPLNTSSSQTIDLLGVTVGTWDVYAEGYDSKGNKIASTLTRQIRINERTDTLINLEMIAVTDLGSLEVTLAWCEGVSNDVVAIRYRILDDTRSNVYFPGGSGMTLYMEKPTGGWPLDKDENKAHVPLVWANGPKYAMQKGNYYLEVTLYGDEGKPISSPAPYIELIQIKPGLISSKTIRFDKDADYFEVKDTIEEDEYLDPQKIDSITINKTQVSADEYILTIVFRDKDKKPLQGEPKDARYSWYYYESGKTETTLEDSGSSLVFNKSNYALDDKEYKVRAELKYGDKDQDFQQSEYVVVSFGNSYTITYRANGGEGSSATQTATTGDSIEISSGDIFERIGYTFDKWNTNADGEGTKYDKGANYTESTSIVLYAQWTANKYKATFVGNYESSTYSEEETVTFDQNYTLPTAEPTRTNYSFTGWFTASTGGSKVTTSTKVTTAEDHTLYAQWEELGTYTVTYNPNGGEGTVAATTNYEGEEVTLSDGTGITKTGYSFESWNTEANGEGTKYDKGANYTESTSIVLYAQWKANEHTLTFNANGGITPEPGSKSVTYDQPYGDLPAVTRTGYSFGGWYLNSTQVNSGSVVKTDSNHELIAQWTANKYIVTFDTTGGGAASPATKEVTYGETYGDLATTSRTGHTFTGWYTASSGGSKVEATTSVAITADQTLYARWTADTYTVTYNDNGSSGGNVPANQTKTHGTDLTLATNTGNLAKTGYTFDGWNTKADGSGTSYPVGSSYTLNATLTLYAKWKAPEYTVGSTGPAGGKIFYDKGNSNDGWRYLEAAPFDVVRETKVAFVWGGYGTNVGGTGTAIGTGKANTDAIRAKFGATEPYYNNTDYAAKVAREYSYGEYTDWFLPSKDELNEMYKNKGTIGGFQNAYYWSSSEYSSVSAWKQNFSNGSQYNTNRNNISRVRPVRAF